MEEGGVRKQESCSVPGTARLLYSPLTTFGSMKLRRSGRVQTCPQGSSARRFSLLVPTPDSTILSVLLYSVDPQRQAVQRQQEQRGPRRPASHRRPLARKDLETKRGPRARSGGEGAGLASASAGKTRDRVLEDEASCRKWWRRAGVLNPKEPGQRRRAATSISSRLQPESATGQRSCLPEPGPLLQAAGRLMVSHSFAEATRRATSAK
jgi:hypothetical protein